MVSPTHEFEPIKMLHTFPIEDEVVDDSEESEEIGTDAVSSKLLCQELLYVSDTATESHFPFKGMKNHGMPNDALPSTCIRS